MSVFHLARWHLASEASQVWQMYILVVVLICSVTWKKQKLIRTDTALNLPLSTPFFLICFCPNIKSFLHSSLPLPNPNPNPRTLPHPLFKVPPPCDWSGRLESPGRLGIGGEGEKAAGCRRSAWCRSSEALVQKKPALYETLKLRKKKSQEFSFRFFFFLGFSGFVFFFSPISAPPPLSCQAQMECSPSKCIAGFCKDI